MRSTVGSMPVQTHPEAGLQGGLPVQSSPTDWLTRYLQWDLIHWYAFNSFRGTWEPQWQLSQVIATSNSLCLIPHLPGSRSSLANSSIALRPALRSMPMAFYLLYTFSVPGSLLYTLQVISITLFIFYK